MSDPSARITSHMNKSHQLAVIDYLVVYGQVPLGAFDRESVILSEINTKWFTIEYKDKSLKKKTIKINWSDAKEDEDIVVSEYANIKGKLVSMAKYAAAKQGYSHQQITKVLGPDSKSILLYFFSAALVYSSYDLAGFKSLFVNDRVFSIVSQYFPSFVWSILNFTGKNSKYILGGLVSIHLIEIISFTIPQTRKYRVPLASRLSWIFMHIFEGFFVILRFKSLIEK
ncbi:hypothetical protein CAAN1_02S06810 [[Candida] anglica]|uniref:DUF2470 domain-containing protein n=1 Tax=[Candida] anglica TaxID=148631 RepID=A0ABP0EEU3_9ASCO